MIMKNISILFGIILFCQTVACKQPTEISSDTDILWKSSISPSLIYDVFPKFVYKNAIITQGVKNRSSVIMAFDKNTGKDLWVWNDKIDGHEIFTNKVHMYKNTVVWRYAGRVYGINLDNGQTAWKERAIYSRGWGGNDAISGVSEHFLFHTGHQEYFCGYTSTGNLQQSPTLTTPAGTIHTSTLMFLNAPPNILENVALNDTIAVLPFGIPTGGQAIGFKYVARFSLY
jgi:hypothetical protein